VPFHRICSVRDVLAVLIEAGCALRVARSVGYRGDPVFEHVEAARSTNPHTDLYVYVAESLAVGNVRRCWKRFIDLMIWLLAEDGENGG
jgi:hypothetical protein